MIKLSTIPFAKILKRMGMFFLFLLLLIMILPYCFPLGAQQRKDMPFPESQFVKFFGTEVHYRVFESHADTLRGNVMLVHGFSGSTFSFRKQFDTLNSCGYNVLALDLPAFGFSDKSEDANLSDSIRNDILLGLTQLVEKDLPFSFGQFPEWSLVGHSMGGTVIASFASEYPTKVKSLIFTDGVHGLFPSKRDWKVRLTSALLRAGFVKRWADVLTEYYFARPKKFKELLSSAYGIEPDEEALNGYLQPFLLEGSGSSIFEMFSRTGYAPIDDTIISSFPSLLIWGEKDAWIPISVGEEYKEKHPRTEFFIVPDAGHCPMETRPLIYNSALIEFLNTLPEK